MLKELIIILFMLSLIALPLQFAIIRRRYVVYVGILLIGIFTFLMHTRAIEQSYTKFNQQLADTGLTGNLLVLQIIESIGGILLSTYLLSLYHGEWIKRGYRFFKYIPGIIPFVALFYLESYLFLNFHGIEFHYLALIIAIGFMLIIMAGMHLFKWLLGDYDIMLEIKFFLHIIQVIVALIISVDLFGLRVPRQTGYLSLKQTLITLVAIIMVILLGFLFYQLKIKNITKKKYG
ncbi:MAG: hypothetical protein ACOCXH_00420 [Cyclobacteriaceae bacterium]